MKLIESIHQSDFHLKSSVLSVGNFDGVHLGHRQLLARLKDCSQKFDVPSVVLSFEPHPVKVLFPEKKLHRIFSLEDQEQVFEDLKIDFFVREAFSRSLSSQSPESFLNEWMIKPLNPKAIVIGYDFSFGANRKGNADFLKEKGRENGFEVHVVPPFKIDEQIISSTLIRKAIESGDMQKANLYLGRHFYLQGLVEKGANRGKAIGFPTANLYTEAELLPASGVYACRVQIRGDYFSCITNIGVNPTFGGVNRRPIQIETHILNFSDNIYGEKIKLEFLSFIRAEKKFENAQQLKQQIEKDIDKVKQIYAQMG